MIPPFFSNHRLNNRSKQYVIHKRIKHIYFIYVSHSKCTSSNVLDTVSYQLRMQQHLSHSQPVQMHCFEGCQICSWLVPLLPFQLQWFVGLLHRWSLRPRYQFYCCKLCDVVLTLQCLGNNCHTFCRNVWSLSSSQMDSSCRTKGRSICCLEPTDQRCCVSINQENDQWVWYH